LCSSLLQNIVAAQTNKLARRYQEEMDKKEKILRNYLEDSIKETKEGLEKIRGEFYDIRAQVLKEMNSIQELDSGLKNLTDLNLEGESEEVKEGKDGL
jgi:Mg2+ and Co2+ transporter CorA